MASANAGERGERMGGGCVMGYSPLQGIGNAIRSAALIIIISLLVLVMISLALWKLDL